MTQAHFSKAWRLVGAIALAMAAAACGAGPSDATSTVPSAASARAAAARAPGIIRVATFNAHLNRDAPFTLVEEAASGDSPQIAAVAEIIQRVDPDILLINEIDRDAVGRAPALLKAYFLSRGRNGAAPVEFPYVYFAPVNTGVASGVDLDRDGRAATAPGEKGYAEDAFGYGAFPGQYGMALLSKFPIESDRVRTFQKFLWKDMPGALLPDDPLTGAAGGYYSKAALAVLRLSSKSHWDVPVRIGDEILHVLASHPTPPAFDGAEARNRRRNHDEIRFWADYVAPERAQHLYDDAGKRGGLAAGARFVVLGDLNADPEDGASWPGAIGQLLDHPAINAAMTPASAGAAAAAAQGGANLAHAGDPAADTADFADEEGRGPGNLRTDYVLPSRAGLEVVSAGVFWPEPGAERRGLVGEGWPVVSSDHRLVWTDMRLIAGPASEGRRE
jgi:endonuclease/exonuclease/phosphatase family metal-dependent hydrolase